MKNAQRLITLMGFIAFAAVRLNATSVDAKLDAAKTGAPINELIYSQFIEHLGGCIFGGIWAEMACTARM